MKSIYITTAILGLAVAAPLWAADKTNSVGVGVDASGAANGSVGPVTGGPSGGSGSGSVKAGAAVGGNAYPSGPSQPGVDAGGAINGSVGATSRDGNRRDGSSAGAGVRTNAGAAATTGGPGTLKRHDGSAGTDVSGSGAVTGVK